MKDGVYFAALMDLKGVKMADHTGRQVQVRVWLCFACCKSGWVELRIIEGHSIHPKYDAKTAHEQSSPHCMAQQPCIMHGFEACNHVHPIRS